MHTLLLYIFHVNFLLLEFELANFLIHFHTLHQVISLDVEIILGLKKGVLHKDTYQHFLHSGCQHGDCCPFAGGECLGRF